MIGNIRACAVALVSSLVLVNVVKAADAEVNITKKGSGFRGNPSLAFNGVSGDTAVSNAIMSDLARCGWFKVVKGYGDYKVSGSAAGGALNLTVTDKDKRSFSMKINYSKSNPRTTAHTVVDSILKKLFKVDGICASKVAFCVQTQRGKKEVYVADFDGQNVVPVTKSGTLSVEPDWVPGKMNLVYTKYGTSYTDIVETDLITKKSRRLAQYPGLNSGGAISPDGRTIALTLSRDGQVELYSKAIGQRGQNRLTSSRSVEASPCWSPNGRMLCFVSDIIGRPKLYLMGADGRGMRDVVTKGIEAVSPDWSATNKIVYAAKEGGSYKIAVTDLATGKSEIVLKQAGDWESPSWAPDNRHVVCSRTVGGKSSLVVVDTWAGTFRELVRSPSNLSLPSWSNLF